jgi:hypothetical protein
MEEGGVRRNAQGVGWGTSQRAADYANETNDVRPRSAGATVRAD